MSKISSVQMVAIIILVLFLFSFGNTYSQKLLPSDTLSVLLTSKENEMFSIITNGNKEAADRLIAQDYITINADGKMEGKEATMKTIGKFKGSNVRLSDKIIRVYGDIAIINGKASFYLKQVLVAEIFYTEIWNYHNQQWQFIGWQGTMTGLPSYYPVIITIIIILLLYLVIKLIRRKWRGNKIKN